MSSRAIIFATLGLFLSMGITSYLMVQSMPKSTPGSSTGTQSTAELNQSNMPAADADPATGYPDASGSVPDSSNYDYQSTPTYDDSAAPSYDDDAVEYPSDDTAGSGSPTYGEETPSFPGYDE